MKFKTKRDAVFIWLWVAIIAMINAMFLIAYLLDDELTPTGLMIVVLFDIAVSVLMIWLAMDIKYVMKEDYLLVKGGIFRSKIRYSDITKITGDPNLWVGYRILFSRDAIELHYKTGFMGSVVISPENQEEFIRELQRRNPGIKVDVEPS